MRINKIISLLLAAVMLAGTLVLAGAAAPSGNTLTANLPDLTATPSAEPTEVTVSGTSVQYPGTVVTIAVWYPLKSADKAEPANVRNEAAFFDEVALDSNSAFTVKFNISGNGQTPAPSGRYTVNAFVPGLDAPMTASFDYKDVAAANAVVSAVDGASLSSEVQAALDSGISAVDVAAGVSYSNYAYDSQRAEVANHIFTTFENTTPVAEADIARELTAITSALDAIVDLTDDTRDDMRDNLAGYTSASYSGLMGFTADDINTYNSVLTDEQREKAVVYMAGNSKNLILPEDLTALFGDALEEAQKSDSANDYQDSTGGRGNGGGGGGGRLSVGQEAMPPVQGNLPSQGLDAFADIDNVAWAKNAINILASKGVVHGKTETEFFPMDAIVREEMVKLLIEGLNIAPASGKTLPFEDVAPNAWYYEYIIQAYTKNITSGISPTEFGVGAEITRQDMAKLIVSALKTAGFTPEQTMDDFVFADDAEIADYAKDSVYILAKAGLINGVGDNCFAPTKTATRAEVAVLLYRAMYKFNLI